MPNEIIGNIFGPVSARENDLGVCHLLSDMNTYLKSLQPKISAFNEGHDLHDCMPYYSGYGDAIFHVYECIIHHYEAPINGKSLPWQIVINDASNSVCETVDWPFGMMENLFHIFKSYQHWRLLNHGQGPSEIPRQ